MFRKSSQVEAGTILYGHPRPGPRLFVEFLSSRFNPSLMIPQKDLDADSIIRGRYVVLQSKDCHALWVSSKAMEGLPLPEAVEGGVIVRDATGHPTGEL